jgi:hypothetical protein
VQGRFVFSSSREPIRCAEAGFFGEKNGQRLRSILALSLRRIAENFFATLFPSNSHIGCAPLGRISRLPVCGRCLEAVRPIERTVCAICGERPLSPYATPHQNGEIECGLCKRARPPFVKAVADESCQGGLRGTGTRGQVQLGYGFRQTSVPELQLRVVHAGS